MVAPTLIDCWHVRDLQRFRAILKGGTSDKGTTAFTGAGSGSYSRSPHSLKDSSGPCPPSEVNRRDHFGRTALHLIASNTEPWSVDYLYAVLAHPSVNVNLQDSESGWTALHRALYLANLQTVIILLRRTDTDTRVKDLEGLTPFDLYNSTVNGTNPPPDALSYDVSHHAHGRTLTQLFTWGSNRNYNLGLGDGDDRQFPDRVNLKQATEPVSSGPLPAGKKFDRIGIKDIAMSRLHTVVLTDEPVSNVWICGLGGNGRLGRSPQTQTSFEPLKDFPDAARLIAVAHDHTLIVTASGAVFSFGLNRFAQLGYVIEQGFGTVASTSGKVGGGANIATFGQTATTALELDVQISPRRIVGPLKKEIVIGAACSKLHSAVFTAEGLYTWGTNTGQLGYDRSGTAIQTQPRRVTALAAGSGIQQIAATEFGTACLMEGGNVFLWHNDTHIRVSFPLARFSTGFSDVRVRPGNAQARTLIAKLSSSGNIFSALSDAGDLFTFNLEHPSEYGGAGGRTTNSKSSAALLAPKPQLVWSVRKKFTAVRDVAIGPDGSVILCTESGHCFVRPRRGDGNFSKASGKGFKFQQIPFLQRVVKVALSESGGLAAIKADPSLPDVRIRGRTVEEALRDLLPHLKVQNITEDAEHQKGITSRVVEIVQSRIIADSDNESDSSEGLDWSANPQATSSGRYLRTALLILEAYKRWVGGRIVFNSESATGNSPAGQRRGFYGPHNLVPPFGCDVFVIAGGHYLPAHRAILAARIPNLRLALATPATKVKALSGVKVGAVNKRVATLTLSFCSLATALFFLHYIYSDDLPPIWVPSIGLAIERELKAARIDRSSVQEELIGLADLLELPALTTSAKANIPRQPIPTLRSNMEELFLSSVDVEDPEQSPFHDVLLQFEDRTVPAHSAILRRAPFFAALFQPHWTADRWNIDNVITLNMQHFRWEVGRLLLLHLYTDSGETIFRNCDAKRTLEQYMDFLVEILAAANELLLDKLKLVASSLLRKRILAHTCGAVMTESAFYQADQLKEITMNYCTRSMETLLEGGMLNELEYSVLRSLTQYVRQKQDEKLRRALASDRLAALIEAHRDFYDDLDIPPPSLHLIVNKVQPRKGLPKLRSPPQTPYDMKRRPSARAEAMSPTTPTMRPSGMTRPYSSNGNDNSEIFVMDEEDAILPAKERANGFRSATTTASPWTPLPQIAQLNLDDNSDRSVTPARLNKEFRASNDSSPALRPVDQPRDLRTIMAREQLRQQQIPILGNTTVSGSSTPVLRGATSTVNEPSPLPLSGVAVRMSQKERKRQQLLQQQQEESNVAVTAPAQALNVKARVSSSISPWKTGAGSSPPSTSASPWSLKAAGTTAMTASGSQERAISTSPSPANRTFAVTSSPVSKGEAPSASLGPTYTPTRLGATSAPKRAQSGNDAAWAASSLASPAVAQNAALSGSSKSRNFSASAAAPPSVLQRSGSSLNGVSELEIGRNSPAVATSPSTQLTFAQIQEQQRVAIEREYDQARAAAVAKRSFLDIQEEERKTEDRRREEQKQAAEFEKWFAEESKRIIQSQKKATKTDSASAGGKKKTAKKQTAASSGISSAANKAEKQSDSSAKPVAIERRAAAKTSGQSRPKNGPGAARDASSVPNNSQSSEKRNAPLPPRPADTVLSAAAPTFQPR